MEFEAELRFKRDNRLEEFLAIETANSVWPRSAATETRTEWPFIDGAYQYLSMSSLKNGAVLANERDLS